MFSTVFPPDALTTSLPTLQSTDRVSPKIKALLALFKQSLQDLYGDRLAHLVLFGSHARNEATPDSDVDVLVVLTKMGSPFDEIGRTSDIEMELLLEYGELISVVPMTEHKFLYGDTPLLLNIRLEGILV